MSTGVLCVIPARGGSKGLPRKNVLPLAGRPLVGYPIAAAKASGVCDAIFVTTDDEEIAAVARAEGADVPFLRPADLAGDLTTTEATLRHALLAYESHTGRQFDICVFLTPTDIFRSPAWIARAVNLLKEQPKLESAFAGTATHKNYWDREPGGAWVRVLPWMRDYSSRQVRRKIYREDTGLACASRADIWRGGRRIGDVVEIIPNDLPETAIDIHTAFDLFLATKAIEYLRAHHPERLPV